MVDQGRDLARAVAGYRASHVVIVRHAIYRVSRRDPPIGVIRAAQSSA